MLPSKQRDFVRCLGTPQKFICHFLLSDYIFLKEWFLTNKTLRLLLVHIFSIFWQKHLFHPRLCDIMIINKRDSLSLNHLKRGVLLKMMNASIFSSINFNKECNVGFFGFPIRLVCIIVVLILILFNHVPLLTTSNSKIRLNMLYTMLFALVIPKGLITSSGFKFITDLMKL